MLRRSPRSTLFPYTTSSDLRVIYVEFRFAPLLHLEQGLKPEEVVEAVDRATEECIRRTGIEARVNPRTDRKSTRLNSSHANISYAVFCLKKKTKLVLRKHSG